MPRALYVLAFALVAQASFAAKPLPARYLEVHDKAYDGEWTGSSRTLSGPCEREPTVILKISEGRITGTWQSYDGEKISKIYGAMYENQSVVLVLKRAAEKGRLGVARGTFNGNEMTLRDVKKESKCDFEYRLKRAQHEDS